MNMEIPLVALGLLTLCLVYFDMLWTTFGEGGGPITRPVTSLLWRASLGLFHRRGYHTLLKWGGVVVTLSAVALWIFLLWGGWMLIFNAYDTAVVDGATKLPALFWERAYFVGYTIFTLGMGDFLPNGPVWQVLTAISSLSGLFLVTFSITYLVPVVQAATDKRQLAVHIATLGLSPQELLMNTWEADGPAALEDLLKTLTPGLVLLEQRHITYPVLHFLHSTSHVQAISLRVAALDEALTILALGFEHQGGLQQSAYRGARQAITQLLDTLDTAFIKPTDEAPPPPPLAPLRAYGLPAVSDDLFRQRLAALEHRRRLLRAFVESDGWAWEQLQPAPTPHDPLAPLADRPA